MPPGAEIGIGIDVSGTRIAIAAYRPADDMTISMNAHLTAGRQYELIRECLKDMRSEVGHVQAIGIEQPAFGFPKAAYIHGMSVARAEDAARAVWRNVPIRFFQPTEWRRICGVGGKASKDRVKEFVRDEFGFKPKTQDEADAAAVAVAMWLEAFGE